MHALSDLFLAAPKVSLIPVRGALQFPVNACMPQYKEGFAMTWSLNEEVNCLSASLYNPNW